VNFGEKRDRIVEMLNYVEETDCTYRPAWQCQILQMTSNYSVNTPVLALPCTFRSRLYCNYINTVSLKI
jgi:hypothetical protein